MTEKQKGIRVKPLTPILSSKGTLWEDVLFKRGWNELKSEQQIGWATEIYGPADMCMVTVYWPVFDLTQHNIFVDEVGRLDD